MKKIILSAVLMATALCADAQEDNQFAVDAQLRTRAEYNNGAISPRNEGEQAAGFINDRSRLSVTWQRDNLELKASVQQTGVWGQDNLKERNGRVAMNEAWAKLKVTDGFSVQVGRQQLSYDDERLMGASDWDVAGNWHDAVKLQFDDRQGSKWNFVYAFNQLTENNRGNYYAGPMPYKNLELLWYHYDADMLPLGISAMILNVGRESGVHGDGSTKYLQNVGADITFKPDVWDFHGAFYYQLGKNMADQEVSAWMASVKAGYQLDAMWKVSAGYDYLSGTDGGNKYKAFDALYGTHHKFYGNMDYFSGNLACGLQDIQAGIDARVNEKMSAALNYHYLLTAEKVADKKGLGHEFDLKFGLKLMKDVDLQCGYSFMLGSETMDMVKGGNHKSWQDWGWLQLNVSPRLLFAKW